MEKINFGPMLNAYPDSLGGTLSDAVELLKDEPVKGAFSSFYILPSLFNTDLDRGFSVIDYGINGVIAKEEDLSALQAMGVDLKLDIILNHMSVQSPQFQDLLQKGDASEYKDFFIDWNKFWEGCGDIDEEGVLVPRQEYIKDMFFRKPGLPVLVVEFADGTKKPYWNTFYQQVDVDENGQKHYLGQMDLNINSPLVKEFYQQTLKTLAGYGAKIVRLDAFAYAPKEVGAKNFLNDPGTWDFLQELTDMAQPTAWPCCRRSTPATRKASTGLSGTRGTWCTTSSCPACCWTLSSRSPARCWLSGPTRSCPPGCRR